MSQPDKQHELAALAKSLRETASRLRKAAKLIGAKQTPELLKTSRATLASQIDEAPTNGKPLDDVKVKSNRKSSMKTKQDKPAKAKKRTRK